MGRAHFFNLTARVMRNVVVDFARRRDAEKRGAALRVSWPEGLDPEAAGEGSEVDLLALDAALARLQAESPRLARVVELRFFAGLAAGGDRQPPRRRRAHPQARLAQGPGVPPRRARDESRA